MSSHHCLSYRSTNLPAPYTHPQPLRHAYLKLGTATPEEPQCPPGSMRHTSQGKKLGPTPRACRRRLQFSVIASELPNRANTPGPRSTAHFSVSKICRPEKCTSTSGNNLCAKTTQQEHLRITYLERLWHVTLRSRTYDFLHLDVSKTRPCQTPRGKVVTTRKKRPSRRPSHTITPS
jgi:hypothetical protein